MAYSDFTLTDIKEKFNLSFNEKERLFSDVDSSEYSDHLKETLQYNVPLATAINTEKARSELIVMPVLVEILKRLNHEISLFSGIEFNVDKEQGLNGICDYIISLSPEQLFLDVPVITIVEAKNDNLKSGYGQAISAMVASKMYNDSKGRSIENLYGVVTTGSLWNFFKLSDNVVWVDRDEYHISNLPKLIGIFLHIISKIIK
jgi:hypothetical protein